MITSVRNPSQNRRIGHGQRLQRKLILKSNLCPGDILMLTAAVRDLHRTYPNNFLTDVRTSAMPLWEHNPYITALDEADPNVEVLDMHYPLINHSNQRPYHFIHGYAQFLGQYIGMPIPVTEFKGDIHLSNDEKGWMSQVAETGFEGNFWIVMAGGKYDYTTKWWDPSAYQAVVDHFADRIVFVQCGEANHWHPPLRGVLNLVGKTDIRQFVRLMYHADGVLCPVTFAMHLAAAVELKSGKNQRGCVVVAGGREPTHWESYSTHQFLHNVGTLTCCQSGGCWKSRTFKLPDQSSGNDSLCHLPVDVGVNPKEPNNRLLVPKCMVDITAADVIRAIERYYDGNTLRYNKSNQIHEWIARQQLTTVERNQQPVLSDS